MNPKNKSVADTLGRMEARLDKALTEPRARTMHPPVPYDEHKRAVRAAHRRGLRDGYLLARRDLAKTEQAFLQALAADADNDDDAESARKYRHG